MSDPEGHYFTSRKQEDGCHACIILGAILIICAGFGVFGPNKDWPLAVIAGLSGILVIFVGVHEIVQELKARMVDQGGDDQPKP